MTHKEQLYSTYTTKKPGKNEKELTSLFSTSVAKYNSQSPCERTAGVVEWALPACTTSRWGWVGWTLLPPKKQHSSAQYQEKMPFFFFFFIAVVKNNTIL